MVIRDAIPSCGAGSKKPELDEKKIVLFNTRMSPYCQRVRLMLNAKNIPFQITNIDIWNKPEWFLGITPLNKVPAFVEPGGAVLYESLIIAEYVDDKYHTEKRFLPIDPYKKAQEKILIERIITAVGDPVRQVAMTGEKKAGEILIEAIKNVADLLKHDYFAGHSMGFVDLMVYPWFDRAPAYLGFVGLSLDSGDERLKRISSWRGRMLSDTAVMGSSYSSECYTAMVNSRRSGKPTPDVGLDLQ